MLTRAAVKMLERQLAQAKGHLQRVAQALSETLSKPDLTLEELELLIRSYDSKLDKYEELQDKYELEVEETQMSQVMDESHTFKQECGKPRALAQRKVKDLVVAETQDRLTTDSQVTKAKLPKVELPKFSGDLLKWTSVGVLYDNTPLTSARGVAGPGWTLCSAAPSNTAV